MFRQALDLGYDAAAPPIDLGQHAAGPVRLAKFSPTGRWLVTVGKNTASVQVLNLEAAAPAAQAVVLEPQESLVNCAEFCQDGHRLLTAGQDACVRLWDLSASDRSSPGREIGRHAGDVVSLAMGPEDEWVASADFGGVIQRWSLDESRAGEPITTIQHEPEIREIQCDRGGRWLVAASHQGSLYRWDLTAADPESTVRQLSAAGEEIKCGVFDLQRQQYIGGAVGGALRVWPLEGEPGQGDQTRTAHSDDIECLAVSPDGKWLVTGGLDGDARIWELANQLTGEPQVLLGHENLVSAIAIDARAHWVVTGSWDKSIRVWDMTASNPSASCLVLEGLADRVQSLAIGPDGCWLAAVGGDGKAVLWDLRRRLLAKGAEGAP